MSLNHKNINNETIDYYNENAAAFIDSRSMQMYLYYTAGLRNILLRDAEYWIWVVEAAGTADIFTSTDMMLWQQIHRKPCAHRRSLWWTSRS